MPPPASRASLPRLAPKPKRAADAVPEQNSREKRAKTSVSNDTRVVASPVERASSSASLNADNMYSARMNVTPTTAAVQDFGEFPLDMAAWASMENPDFLDQTHGNQADDGVFHTDCTPAGQTLSPNLLPDFKPAVVTSNFVNNEFVTSKTRQWSLVHDPATQQLLTRVPESTASEVHAAVAAAEEGQSYWSQLPLSKRRVPLLRLIELMRVNENELIGAIVREVGKTIADARSEISRAINMIEAALSVTSSILGFHFINEATATSTINEPLGVCVAITPFNFPLMTPMWLVPFAVATGNSVVLKPSEQAPLTMTVIAKLFVEAKFPRAVLNIVHGGPAVVDKLITEPAVKAVSFIGSDEAGAHVYKTAITAMKRTQANCGSKNHGVILPDADVSSTLHALAASAFGAAGQRCMGLSAAVFVGESRTWIPALVEIAKQFVVGSGATPGVSLGPVISRKAKKRVEDIIQSAADDGADILLDGRGVKVPDFPEGNFIGPTVISNVQTYMECYQKEIMGPVLVFLQVDNLEEAIEVLNENRYGNGCSIFTTNSGKAMTFQKKVNIGRIGINVPLLATSGQVSNSSNKDSFLGDINIHGFKGHQFFTTTKTIATLWKD